MTRTRGILLGTLALGSILAAILWLTAPQKPSQLLAGLNLSTLERTTGTNGLVTCSLNVTNATNRRVALRARLERLNAPGEWLAVPCALPGPMYGTGLLLLNSGETKSVLLPAPPSDLVDATYRIGVDYWPAET